MESRLKDAVAFRANGEMVFFSRNSNCDSHGTVVGKTHEGNYIVNNDDGTFIVDSVMFTVLN